METVNRRYVLLMPLAVLFLAFGVYMLIAAYYQDHPFVFLALFFSSSLIVLLSTAFLVGVIWRIRTMRDPGEREDGDSGT